MIYTILFGQYISTLLLSANKNNSADLVKLGVTGNFGLIRDSTNKSLTCFVKMPE